MHSHAGGRVAHGGRKTASERVSPRRRVVHIAVIGPSGDRDDLAVVAHLVGRGIGEAGAILVCGGLGGVMAAACRGAFEAGGTTVGILPGTERGTSNRWVSVEIPTGLGEARNALVVQSADAVIAIGGGYGTLSEVGLALRCGRPVVGLKTWSLVRPDGSVDDGMTTAGDAAAAVASALDLAT